MRMETAERKVKLSRGKERERLRKVYDKSMWDGVRKRRK